MVNYWTADDHYGHANIALYCKRPIIRKGDLDEKGKWVSKEVAVAAAIRMNAFLTKQTNMRVKPDDVVTHVGDFMNYGSCRGDPGLRLKAEDYIKQLNGKWIMIEGNHDANNGVKTIGRHLITSIAKKRVFVSHFPTDNAIHDQDLMKWVRKACDIAIVGHVHEKWSYMWDGDLLNINVGVDVRNFRPVSDGEIYNIYEKACRERKGLNV